LLESLNHLPGLEFVKVIPSHDTIIGGVFYPHTGDYAVNDHHSFGRIAVVTVVYPRLD